VIGIISFQFSVESNLSVLKTENCSFSFSPVNAATCGQKKAVAQVVIVNRIGCCRDFAGDAFECAPLLFNGIRYLSRLLYGAMGANSFRVNAKLYVGHNSLSEQGIETEEQLSAHGFKLLLPCDIRNRHDQSFAVKTKRHGLRAKALARDTTPCDERGGFQDFLCLASRTKELWQCSN
jgi:hypothetical protein